jgi:hypothetical protein
MDSGIRRVVRCGSVIRSAFLHRAGVIRGCRSDNQQPLLFLPLRCRPKDVQSTNQSSELACSASLIRKLLRLSLRCNANLGSALILQQISFEKLCEVVDYGEEKL